jgi:putative endonuclease
MSAESWHVYILSCADNTLYTGITTDLKRRVNDHNAGTGARYTAGRTPVRLVYSEKAKDRSEASKREYEIKQLSRSKKMELIAGSLLHSGVS